MIGFVVMPPQVQAQACECTDPGCREHVGHSSCLSDGELVILYRMDMEDLIGTLFCEACADDAEESGLFDRKPRSS